jgi:predicted transcriptional regulator
MKYFDCLAGWERYTVNEIAMPQLTELTVGINENIFSVITHMQKTGQSRVVVIDGDKQPKGIIVFKDILKYLSEKMNL